MGQGIGVLLLAASVGYLVLERAEKHKGLLKRVGQFVGLFVIAASVVSVACRALGCGWGRNAYGPGKMLGCPYSSKGASSPIIPEAQPPQ